jgi:hypothetical protein
MCEWEQGIQLQMACDLASIDWLHPEQPAIGETKHTQASFYRNVILGQTRAELLKKAQVDFSVIFSSPSTNSCFLRGVFHAQLPFSFDFLTFFAHSRFP